MRAGSEWEAGVQCGAVEFVPPDTMLVGDVHLAAALLADHVSGADGALRFQLRVQLLFFLFFIFLKGIN